MAAEIQRKTTTAVQKPNAIMLSLQEVQWAKLNASANNLSNASTVGFKALTVNSQEVIYVTKNTHKNVSYVKSVGVVRDVTNGGITMTYNPLDVAITGQGYFAVQTSAGIRYTRNGQFTRNTEGKFVTHSGYPVLDNGGSEIFIPGSFKSLNISQDGRISSEGNDLGRLGVFKFEDEQSLISEGTNLYVTSSQSQPADKAILIQGALEDSNVSPVLESIRLMEISRLYENSQKVIDEYEQIQKKVINASSRNS